MTTRADRRGAALRMAWVLCAALLLGPGCAIRHVTSGRPLPDPSGLVAGQTTKAQALAALGAPHFVQRQYDGELMVWRRDDAYTTRLRLIPYLVIYERTRGDLRQDQLALLFDTEGVLRGLGEFRDIDDD